LYERAMEYALSGIKEGEILPVIYDLYSGTGTITQLMSKVASQVIGVEIVEEAVESARINAERNHIDNAEFICGDVFKILCGETGEHLPKPDMIIIDPPREGVHPKALTKIVNYGVEKLVYISCKPTSLANDLLAFKEGGYVLEKVSCVDMFPDTVHVETVCLLSRA
ncbi:MAG: class I SAM-dependent RNA methyltransferase, partial [Parasporobacterium sp.]|nr:class I SAM-dependent RNA methyltransferase [Parasporobacterium sp.]